jgi:hypothetical protein
MSLQLEKISFDEVLELDEKAGDNEVLKIEKQDQLESKAKDLKIKIAKAKNRFKKSVIDPRTDSVAILIDIEVMEKELEYTQNVLEAIFPTK